ncbi:hypothetical protein QQS21_004908 [Conoideocrella luteorostrata]|uniref:AB hydrolase-1 domain-containing protein n=1 Tax=Conoideocrella luteorostrata TaxID=1105319 RepID=A0AAJ0CUL9_9HYPO|nr:hypothetical protein QQS21_004908 [Conoideocrella luteorostrata]
MLVKLDAIKYALDGPINSSGGPEHIEQALRGTSVAAANYSFASDDGTQIVYHVCGSGPVLIVATAPGWGVGINYLPNALKPLVDSGKFTLLAIQPRGSLPSERPADDSRMSSKHMAADIDVLRRHLGHAAINVLGHSNGAAIALAYAEMFPSHCAKALLIETQVIGFRGPGIGPELEKRKEDPRYAEAVKAFMEDMRKTFTTDEEITKHIQRIITLYFFDPESGVAEFARNTGPLNVQLWASTRQDEADEMPESNLFDNLDAVTADTLLISGSDDFICTVAASRAAQKGIGSRAKHVVYQDCGHMPWIESEEAFFRDVKEFLLQ